jgi:hypothetical protein
MRPASGLTKVLYVRVKPQHFHYVCDRAKEKRTSRSAVVDRLIHLSIIKVRHHAKRKQEKAAT